MRTAFLAALALSVLTGCVATAPGGSGNGGEQLRLQQASTLRRAGVSDACIAELPLSTLVQVQGIAGERARSSKDVLQQRQRIRVAAGRVCPEL